MRTLVAVAVLAVGICLPAGAQDMSAMCGNAEALKAAPQLAQFCAGAGSSPNPDAGGLKPSGGAMGNLGTAGAGGMPDMSKLMQGGGMPGMPPGAMPPGMPPGAGGGGGEGGGQGAAPPQAPMQMGNSGGGPAASSRASSISSISGQFKGFSDAGAIKAKMQQEAAAKAAQKAAAEEALRKKQSAAKAAVEAEKAAKAKEAALKLAEEERIKKEKEAESARLAAELAALKTATAAAEAPPLPSLRTPPSQNPVLYSFELTTPLLRDVDLDEPYGGLRKLYDTPLAPPNLDLSLKDGLSLESPPRLMFNLVPLENDPFNFGLPKRGPAGPSGWIAKILALLPPSLGGRRGAGSPYLGFDEYRPPAGKAEPFAIGVVPQLIYWSGPAPGAPLADAKQAPAAAKLPAASGILGDASSPEEPAASAASAWGL